MSSPTEAVRRQPAAGRAAARARASALLAWLAAAAGIAIVLVYIVEAGLFSALMPKDAISPVAVDHPDQIAAYRSTVTGFDREEQPYELTAARGLQDRERPELVHLETVAGKFRKSTGQNYDLAANAALYDTKSKRLDLDGAVTIRRAGRFTLRLAKALVDVEDKSLTSAAPVTVEMADGSIAANGVQITDDGRTILFLNGVKARFAIEAAEGGVAR